MLQGSPDPVINLFTLKKHLKQLFMFTVKKIYLSGPKSHTKCLVPQVAPLNNSKAPGLQRESCQPGAWHQHITT